MSPNDPIRPDGENADDLPDPDEQWEDIVRRLGGSAEQAQSAPRVEQSPRHTPRPLGPRDYIPPEEEIEDFVPPEPPPVGAGRPRVVLSWTAVIGVPLLALVLGIVGVDIPTWFVIAAIVALVAGAVSLFFLLPSSSKKAGRNTWDDDDGVRF